MLVRRIEIEGSSAPRKLYDKNMKCNGTKQQGGSIVFTTHDPNLEWNMEKIRKKAGSGDLVHVTLQMTGLPSTMAQQIEQQTKKRSL